MTMTLDPDTRLHLENHASLTRDLAAAIRELGDTRSAIVSNRARLWENLPHLGVTERREMCSAGVADLAAEAENQQAEVDALRVELATIEIQLRALTGGVV